MFADDGTEAGGCLLCAPGQRHGVFGHRFDLRRRLNRPPPPASPTSEDGVDGPSRGIGRRSLLRASLPVLAASAGVLSAEKALASGATGPYSRGGGQTINIGGRSFTRDQVYRVLPVTLPLQQLRVTSLFGMRTHPILGYRRGHWGVDLGGPIGTPIFATGAGRVSHASEANGYGKMVEVQHGLGFASRYAHMSSISVQVGQVVDRHQVVGEVGVTGHVTGPHLHYEIRRNDGPTDPIAFVLRAHAVYDTLG